MATVYIIMGVSGCGKTTIGKMLSEQLGIPFYDADDFHPQVNIDKMVSGKPLEDQDRWPWLDILAQDIKKWSKSKGAILACSALKEVYRERLFVNNDVFAAAKKNFIYLDADYDFIKRRLEMRKNHFFNSSLLQSQFDTLEAPNYGIHIDVTETKEVIVNRIIKTIRS